MIKYFIFIILISKIALADPAFSPIAEIKIDNIKKFKLGKILYFDPNLSSDKTIACVNCHVLELAGADGTKFSTGVKDKIGVINSPTIFNTRFNIAQDWIGEYNTIKKRTQMAFLSKIEMAGDIKKTLKYIRSKKELNKKFKEVYKDFKEDNVYDAIAYYVSNLTTPNSKFDKFLKGKTNIFNKEEKKGLKLFKKYGCVSCHNGINLGGNMYQKFGIFEEKKIKRGQNQGRYKITKKEYDRYVFKVPTLRNITKTSPYMHHGEFNNLNDAIYEMGIHQLGINIPKDDILKIRLFLKTLEGAIPNE